MRIALIYLQGEWEAPPLGLAYIASYMRKHGDYEDVTIIDRGDPIKQLERIDPDIVGISAMSNNFNRAKTISKKIKDRFQVPMILGGPHISLLPETLPESFDVGVMGEGEKTMLELSEAYREDGNLEMERLKDIKGLVFREDGEIIKTDPRPLIEPVDKMPFPERELLEMEEYYLQPGQTSYSTGVLSIGTHIITSRGCPYECNFCASPVIWEKYRMHSAEYIVNEIEQILENYDVKTISFLDDLFLASKERLGKIAELIQDRGLNKKVNFAGWARTDLIDEETCKLLNKMNLKYISFGFESYSEKILGYLKGGMKPEDHDKALRLCNKFDIKVTGHFMFGSPFEKEKDIDKTFDFIKKHINKDLWDPSVKILKLRPCSEVLRKAKNEGLVPKNPDWEKLNRKVENDELFFVPEDMTKEEFLEKIDKIKKFIRKKNREAGLEFNLGDFLDHRIMKKILSNPDRATRYLRRVLKI